MELPAFERAVQLAEQFGPFLFAVLFILVITRTAHAWYQDAIRRDDPPPSAEERRTYRFYFLCSVWTGLAVMSLAVGWWLYANWRGNNIYQVAILNLKSDETISANYFSKSVPRPVVAGGTPIHDVFLLIVRDQPFRIGEKFPVSYYKFGNVPASGLVAVDPIPLDIVYSGQHRDSFHVRVKDGMPTLIADSAAWPHLTTSSSEHRSIFSSMGTGGE